MPKYAHHSLLSQFTLNGTPCIIPVKDLADTAVRHPELPGDDAGPDPGRGHLDDLEPDVIGKRSAIDKHATQLVDTTLA